MSTIPCHKGGHNCLWPACELDCDGRPGVRQDNISMHPCVAAAINELDAAIFSGDTFFNTENLEELKRVLARWQRKIPDLEEISRVIDDED